MAEYQGGMETDGRDYHILYDACQSIKGVPGLTCELGIRRGGSSAMIIQACIDNEDKRIHVGIDPYGNIEFPNVNANKPIRSDWTNDMKQKSLPLIYKFCEKNEAEFLFFNLECEEFFKRYPDGIPIYNEYKKIVNEYALVFFDSPPSKDGQTKLKEAEFFQSRMPVGGMFVFDDVEIYNHSVVHKALVDSWGFKKVDADWKWSYKKIKQ